jgi:GPH family glycoside/pentoside/hexuronide:cation symporter
MVKKSMKLSFGEKLGYGCGDFGSVLFWQTIMIHLLFFYTDVFGLEAKVAGIMFFVSRVLDAIFDVVIGMTADRTKSRWGKFRPYILFGAIPLGVAAVFAFTTPNFGEVGKIVYAYVTFILFMFLYSTVNIPYTSLLGVISGDPHERTKAASFKFVGAYLAGIIVSATALPFAEKFEHGTPAKGWQTTMIVYAVVAFIFFMITFLATRERIQPIAKEKTNVKKDLKDISQNTPWIMLFAVTILFILFVCIRLSVTNHYFKYYVDEQVVPWLSHTFNAVNKNILNPVFRILGRPENALLAEGHKFGFEVLASIFHTLGQALSLIGVLLVPYFGKLVGRKNALIILFILAMFFTGAFIFFKPSNLILIYLFQAFGSITGGPISPLLWSMYADTADYSEWKTGRRATGLVFSASIMSNKLGWAFGSMIAAFILSMTGFIPGILQNGGVQNGLKAMMSIIPVAAGVIALLIIILFYKLDDSTMTKIKADLEEKRGEKN